MSRSQIRLDDLPERMSAAQFWDLVGEVEHETLEFKRGIADSLLAAIPAMAMTDGGFVVCGISDHREIAGCSLTQSNQDRLTRYANECNVVVDLKSVEVDGRDIVVMSVPEVHGRIVTTPNGRLLRRVGGDSMPLQGDELGRFVAERQRASAEANPIDGTFDPEAFDLNAVNSALARYGRSEIKVADLQRALVDLNVAEASGSTAGVTVVVAGAVLFARDPRRFVPGAEAQLVRRDGIGPGPGPIVDRESCAGPLAAVLECCVQFVERHTKSFEVVSGLFRETIPEYPVQVLREALLNALAHRDYGLAGATIDITVWDDRIEIRSPGSLPGHINEQNMRVEHFSRNRRLMRVLRDIGLVEEFGEGVDRMYREMEARLMPPPEFEATPSSVTVTLRNQFRVSVEELAWLGVLGDVFASASERLALVEVYRRGSAARRHIADALAEDAEVDRLLARMVDGGLLVRVGRAGGAQYELSPEVVRRAGSARMKTSHLYRQLLLDELASRGGLSSAEAAKLLGVDMAEARRTLNTLAASGLVRAEGNTRARRYLPAPSEE